MAFKELKIEEIATVDIRYSKNLQSAILVWIGIVIFVGILLPTYVQLSGGGFPDIGVYIFFIVLAAALICAWFVIHFTWYRVDNQGIQFHGILRHNFYLAWFEIESVEMTVAKVSSRGTRPHNEYGLRVKGGGRSFTVRRGGLVNGLPQFCVLIRKHVPVKRWAAATEAIRDYSDRIVPNAVDSKAVNWFSVRENRDNVVGVVVIILIIAGFVAAVQYANIQTNSSSMSFVVISVDQDNSTSPPAGYQHVQVSVQMKDNSEREAGDNGETGASASQFELKTDTGAIYHYDPSLFSNVPSGISLTAVDSFEIGFEIPVNEHAKTLYFHYGIFMISASCG